MACRAEARSEADQARLRCFARYGAASFACHSPVTKLAWFTEPKLAEGERRMVDLTSASWNRVVPWMRQLERLRRV